MEYKTYIQKLPIVKAVYDEDSSVYHVIGDNWENDVPKKLFESSWREIKESEQSQIISTGYINELS